MSQKLALSSYPVADSGPSFGASNLFFDISTTVISQYANSPILTGIIARMGAAIDIRVDFDAFFLMVWNIDTAEGWGLDVWGRILGVSRILFIPTGGFFGFQQDADAMTFGYGIFYSGGGSTGNFALSDDAYRRLLLAKAALNITDGSILSINRILTALFPDHGNCYVRDDGGMELTYVFGETLSPAESAIVYQSGVLPKPAGVFASVEQP